MNTKLVIQPTTYMTPVRLEDARKALIKLASLFTDMPLPNQFLPFLVALGDVIMPSESDMTLARVCKHSVVIDRNAIHFEMVVQNIEDQEMQTIRFASFPQCGVLREVCKLPIHQGPGIGQCFFLLNDIIERLYGTQIYGMARRLHGWIRRVVECNPHQLVLSLTPDGLEVSSGSDKPVGLTIPKA